MTVKNYQGDDWALSNRDQQKMAQAEAKVQRDVAACLERQRSRSPSPSGRGRRRCPYCKPFFGRANNPSFKAQTALPAASTAINVQGDTVPKLMSLSAPGDKSNKKSNYGGWKAGTYCFKCGEAGHWQDKCPNFARK